MGIEEVDMNVPVTDYSIAAEVAGENAELQQIIETILAALRACDRASWFPGSRERQNSQLELAFKAAAKRFSVSVASTVDERHARAAIRVRLYSGLMKAVGAIGAHRERRARRRKAIRKFVVLALTFGISVMSVTIVVLLWPAVRQYMSG